jgi:hypothetical protein
MIREIKEIRMMYETNARSHSAKAFLTATQKLKSVIKEARMRGATDDYLYRLETEARTAIIMDYNNSKAQELESYQNQLQALETKYVKDYEKDFALRDFRQRAFERKLKVMLDPEIKRLSLDYINDKLPIDDPGIIDTLINEVRSRNLDQSKDSELDGFQEAMRHKNYDRPFMNTDEAKIINTKIKVLSTDGIGLEYEGSKVAAADPGDIFDCYLNPKMEDEGEEE